MKTIVYFPHQMSVFIKLLLLAALLFSLAAQPTRAATHGTIAPHYITSDTTWAEVDSPWLIDSFVIVNPGVTLTIEAGVEVNGVFINSYNYLFEVDGKLLAQGTPAKPNDHPQHRHGNPQASPRNIHS